MLRWSWPAGIVTTLYTIAATYVVIDELRYTGGGWINLRGMGTMLATLPSYATLGNLLRWLGVAKVDYSYPRAGDYIELVLHVLLSALFVYVVTLGIESLVRRLFVATPS